MALGRITQTVEFDEDVPGLEVAFAEVLRTMRAKRDVSQQALATESGLGRTYISLLERGLRRPSLATVFLLAQALSVTPMEIVAQVDAALRSRMAATKRGMQRRT
ncbi:MAG TPA: helix-turn-helix transcriptional regulator [Candidatus Kapabacteria bacterium]|nr:helix-turn-helix transcriptional regulator [Candidatus Kapabacteria bacterium]